MKSLFLRFKSTISIRSSVTLFTKNSPELEAAPASENISLIFVLLSKNS